MTSTLYQRAQKLTATLWALIAPPTVWALHFLFCYVYAAVRCAKADPPVSLGDVRMTIAIATLVALALVAASAFVALAQSRLEGEPPPYQQSTEEDQHRFLATAKLLLAALSFVAILFTALPAFVFTDCR